MPTPVCPVTTSTPALTTDNSNGDEDDHDPAELVVPVLGPAIMLVKTVYQGHDGGMSCPGTDLEIGIANAPVTYCFVVINTGDTHLNDVTLSDTDLDPDLMQNLGLLAPGQVVTVHTETVISGDLINTADVSGNPSNPDGSDIPGLPDVTDDDPAEVREVAPAIMLEKTVYAGHDSGASCPGVELVTGANGDLVTYCFEVTNIGDVHLTNVTINDNDLTPPVSIVLSGVLAPGASTNAYIETTIQIDLVNTADVVGTPSTPDGDPLPDLPEPTDEDPAEVDQVGPGIQLIKRAGTAADGDTYVISAAGGVLYTYDVTNTGDTHLSDITITDDAGTPGDLSDDVTLTSADCPGLAGPLAPLGMVQCTLTLNVAEDTVNMAGTVGNPTDAAGNDLPGLPDVTDDDPAIVVLETLSIGSTVFLDPNDNGIQDPGEAGIPGILVEVLDAAGNVVGSDTTDSDGNYYVGGLAEGTYTVRITTPPATAPASSTARRLRHDGDLR